MKTLTNVLTRVEKIYNDTITHNGVELCIDPTIMSVYGTVRRGVVVGKPVINRLKLKRGDVVYFHPNQIKTTILNGKEVCSFNCFVREDNVFVIDADEIYAYERDGVFSAVDNHCFVSPYYDLKDRSLDIPDAINKYETKHFGVMRYDNKYLNECGVKKGDIVVFEDYSKHKFVINEQLMFRMDNSSIIGRVYEAN